MTKNRFLRGGLTLTLFSFLAKAVGALYRLPLTNLLGAEGPYPLHEAEGDSSPIASLLYCQSLLLGLLGVQSNGTDSIDICLHLPKAWRHFACRGLHVGGNVLNLLWQDSHLLVGDIFGNVLYNDLALCGQHIQVTLPRIV